VKNRIIGVQKHTYPRWPKRKYVYLSGAACLYIGIKFGKKTVGRNQFTTLEFPPTVQLSRHTYTVEEIIHINELLLQGAVWCEHGNIKKRHFLAVIDKVPQSLLIRRSK
jgi:hypothetical protein